MCNFRYDTGRFRNWVVPTTTTSKLRDTAIEEVLSFGFLCFAGTLLFIALGKAAE